jgi:hypothetical protein
VEPTIPSPTPVEASIDSFESIIRDLNKRITESRNTERCEVCSSYLHSTSSCPFDVHKREVEVALESNSLALNTYVHEEEESTAFESGYDDSLDVKCDSSPMILLEDNVEELITMPEPTEGKESNESFHRCDLEVEISTALNEDEYFSENDSFFGDDEVCPEPPCISHTEFSFSLTPDLLDGISSSKLNEESYYSEFIYDKSGKIGEYSDPFEIYFENLPPELNLFSHIPSHNFHARRFDILKRCLNARLLGFDLSFYQNCFCGMCAEEFDRLLRALTMSDLEHHRSS